MPKARAAVRAAVEVAVRPMAVEVVAVRPKAVVAAAEHEVRPTPVAAADPPEFKLLRHTILRPADLPSLLRAREPRRPRLTFALLM